MESLKMIPSLSPIKKNFINGGYKITHSIYLTNLGGVMNKFTVLLLSALLSLASAAFAQFTIDNFDSAVVNNHYQVNVEGAGSRIDLTDNGTDFIEGTGSMTAKYVIGAFHPWGSYGNLINHAPEEGVWDWTVSDSLSIWIKVAVPPTHPEYMAFRIHIADRPTPDDPIEEYIYENGTIFDAATDWYNLRVPLYERPTDGTTVPNDQGFVLFPTTWGGGTYNNHKLDRNAIRQFNITAVTTGYIAPDNIPADSVTIIYDNFQRVGYRALPFIIFNGMLVPGNLGTAWTWGQSAYELVIGGGATEGTNAIKWTMGDEYGNGWTGFGWTLTNPQNMYGGWMTDSVKFKMKAGAATGALRMQFESGANGKVGLVFTPTADDQWHSYALALRDFVYQDNTTDFDTMAVITVGLMAEASGVAGTVVYLDDWWTGNPVFDVIPPKPASNLLVVNETYSNLVTWTDTPNETNETYNVYYSKHPITDVKAAGVDVVEMGMGVPENTSNISHLLFSPVADSTVSYYYAVVTVDDAGNESTPVVTASPITNTAKGIVTIAHTTPASFAADGNLSDWAGITPFRLFKSEGAHVVTNTTITNDDDCSALFYIAMDADYLYVAFDVTDDIVDYSATSSWLQDSPDLYLGLYNYHRAPHGNYQTGSAPDYHFRLNHDQWIIDNRGSLVVLAASDADYYWEEKFPSGYIVEARIAWSALATETGDATFVPVEGYRIPMNFSINDSDVPGEREGILTWSPYDDDTAYKSPIYWLYTWIGNIDIGDGIRDVNQKPSTYSLDQNYPNPFNPLTTITYSLAKAGKVRVDVFNTLGQRIQTLVDTYLPAGEHKTQFDGSKVASGVYFYQIMTGEFRMVRKMVLIR
jgi:hypothetical protein